MLKSENQTWKAEDSILCGLSVTLIFAHVLLLRLFIYKIYAMNDCKIFGNKKTSSILDKMYYVTFFMLILQGIVYLVMVFVSKSVTSGLVCSVFSLIFHILHSSLKVLNVFNLFLYHYIWIKQRVLVFLHKGGVLYQIFKLSFAFVLSVSIVLPFKMNVDTAFILVGGLCFGKRLSFQKTLSIISISAALLIAILFVGIQVYYLLRTNQEETKHCSNKRNKIIFELIRRQICSFLKLHVALALLLALYIGLLILLPSPKMTKFADLNYLARHLYNYVFCFILCIFRFTVSKFDVKESYLKIKNYNYKN